MHCTWHPRSLAIGVCIACKSPLCTSCSTKLQGRNLCSACLVVRSAGVQAEARSGGRGVGARSLDLLTVVAAAALCLVGTGLGAVLAWVS